MGDLLSTHGSRAAGFRAKRRCGKFRTSFQPHCETKEAPLSEACGRAVSFERYKFRDRSRGFHKAWRAVIGRELEKALRLLLALLNQRKLATVKISFAG